MSRSVYFAMQAKRIKIGIAANVQSRLLNLQSDTGGPVELIASVAGTPALERALHMKLKAHRIEGEWFHDCPEVRAAIQNSLNNFPAAPDRTERLRTAKNFGVVCRALWPVKTAEELASRVGCSVRCAFGQLSGEREPSARSILVVLTEIIPKQRK